MQGYVYLTTCLTTGKQYVGQSNFEKFKKFYLGSGIYLKNAIGIYGKQNFTRTIIIDNIKTVELLNEYEQYYIDYFNTLIPTGYNLDLGGTGKGKHSEITKSKMSKSAMGHFVSEKNRKALSESAKTRIHLLHTKEIILKIAEKNRGKKRSEEFCKNNSLRHKGQKAWNKGISHSDETKYKISQSRLGFKVSEETKEKLKEKRKGRTPNKNKKFSDEWKRHLSESRQGIKRGKYKIHNGKEL